MALAVPAGIATGTVADRDAVLEELLALHQKRVFRIALRFLGDADEACSASQDCFMNAYRAMDRCPTDALGRHRWLSRLVVNLCLDRLRSRKWKWWRDRLPQPEYEQVDPASSPRTPEREVLSAELGSQLMRALDSLPARQRAVFVLRHYEDYPLEQIAEELGLSVGTVKSHLARALVGLREELREFYGKTTSTSGQ